MYECKIEVGVSFIFHQGSDTMKKIPYTIIPIGLFLMGVITACSFTKTPALGAKAEVPTPTHTPTQTSTPTPTLTSTLTPVPPTPTETPFPTATGISVSPTSQFAPFCQSDAPSQSQCQYPIAEQSSAICINKSPYNLIALNDGATYELLHDYVQCSEAGVIDGQRMIACTGPMVYYFELQVCDSACSGLSIGAEYTQQCPFGYHYNNLQDCCTSETQEVDQGCVVLKLDTKSCTINCGELTKVSTCRDYGYACRWDYENAVCVLKR